MRVEKFQANMPLVDESGKATQITQIALEKLVSEVMALRAKATDLEARLEVLEP